VDGGEKMDTDMCHEKLLEEGCLGAHGAWEGSTFFSLEKF